MQRKLSQSLLGSHKLKTVIKWGIFCLLLCCLGMLLWPEKEKSANQVLRRTPVKTDEQASVNIADKTISVSDYVYALSKKLQWPVMISEAVEGTLRVTDNQLPLRQQFDAVVAQKQLHVSFNSGMRYITTEKLWRKNSNDLARLALNSEQLQPLVMHAFHLRARSADAALSFLQSKNHPLLSERGHVGMDAKSRWIWVSDTEKQIDAIAKALKHFDFPVKQVTVSARLVNVDKTFERQFGVQLGFSGLVSSALDASHHLNVDLPAQGIKGFSAASLGLALGQLDLSLSALESAGHITILSKPLLMTRDAETASIQIGEEIPYQSATESGGTAVSFKRAALTLSVTPHVLAGNHVLLDLAITQNKRGSVISANGPPAIDTREVHTQLEVQEGHTVMLGGLWEVSRQQARTGVPWLQQLPIFGGLFRQKRHSTHQQALYLFITPTDTTSTT
ncbi:MAG: hypothetical protein DHS20C10_09050 [marine bacterium B5-7]|nr:MAG: hypothetical protein DHS20C10_09050 [marine bacterium B5-7]